MKFFLRIVRSLLFIGCSVYVVLILLLAFFENSLVYPGSRYPRGNWSAEKLGFTEVEFKAADGTKLFGWYLPYSGDSQPPSDPQVSPADDQSLRPRTILHCHGNAENIAQVGDSVAKLFRDSLRGNVFLFDYRGYGKSEGGATERGVQQDADAALQWVCQHDNVTPQDVIIVGHSIGGGPACYLANKHGSLALVLQRTFSSLPDTAASHYPMFPVRWMMRNRMDSAQAIKSCKMPLFQSHGTKDQVVPIELGKKVFQNSPAAKKYFFEVPQMSHFDFLPPKYWVKLQAFIDEVVAEKN